MAKTSKIWTIITHEYTTRVKTKGFVIGTLIAPILMLAMVAIPAIVSIFSQDSTDKKLAIIDKTGFIGQQIVARDSAKFYLTDKSEKTLKKLVLDETVDGYVVIDSTTFSTGKAYVYTGGGAAIGLLTTLEKNVADIVKTHRLKEAGASDQVLKVMDSKVDMVTKVVTEEGTRSDNTPVLAIFGLIMGMMIYFLVLMYGQTVMRGVIEEKANRIIEVIASSAKPFDILMGKVMGIGAVGLTQVVVWVVIGAILLVFGVPMFMGPSPAEQIMANGAAGAQGMPPMSGFEIPHISPWVGVAFIFFFLTGFFIYSSLYAAVGSAVDQEQDAQQLVLPVTIPIIIPMFFITMIMNDPDSTASVVLSLIPFFTPIIMTMRFVATDVPFWQIAAAVILQLVTLWGCVWVAAKVYRVGILMYGKKVSFKDLFKWIRQAN